MSISRSEILRKKKKAEEEEETEVEKLPSVKALESVNCQKQRASLGVKFSGKKKKKTRK